MKYALLHANLLDGNLDENGKMNINRNCVVLIDGEVIQSIQSVQDEIPIEYKRVDLNGKYILPGLINMHVHLVPSSKPKSKPTDYDKLSKLIKKHPIILKGFFKIQKKLVKETLFSGVTTIRTVGGLQDLDGKIRDEINAGNILGPRVLSCNTAVSVPNGHFAGILATISHTPQEVMADVEKIVDTNPDWIKLMITGGVLDAKVVGEPGELRMDPEIVKAACDKAHELGYKVSAHVESTQGVQIALENGVDTIEHGAVCTKEIIELFQSRKAADICTISPALPFKECEAFKECYGQTGVVNGTIVTDGIIECAKQCLENNIPVGLGTDTGCPYVMHYDMWRELAYFMKYCGVSSDFAIYTATHKNAEILGILNETGTLEVGKYADYIVVDENPLKDIRVLKNVDMVSYKGNLIKDTKIKKDMSIQKELDKILK